MYCKKCGAQIADDSQFCPSCGTKVDAVAAADAPAAPSPVTGSETAPETSQAPADEVAPVVVPAPVSSVESDAAQPATEVAQPFSPAPEQPTEVQPTTVQPTTVQPTPQPAPGAPVPPVPGAPVPPAGQVNPGQVPAPGQIPLSSEPKKGNGKKIAIIVGIVAVLAILLYMAFGRPKDTYSSNGTSDPGLTKIEDSIGDDDSKSDSKSDTKTETKTDTKTDTKTPATADPIVSTWNITAIMNDGDVTETPDSMIGDSYLKFDADNTVYMYIGDEGHHGTWSVETNDESGTTYTLDFGDGYKKLYAFFNEDDTTDENLYVMIEGDSDSGLRCVNANSES